MCTTLPEPVYLCRTLAVLWAVQAFAHVFWRYCYSYRWGNCSAEGSAWTLSPHLASSCCPHTSLSPSVPHSQLGLPQDRKLPLGMWGFLPSPYQVYLFDCDVFPLRTLTLQLSYHSAEGLSLHFMTLSLTHSNTQYNVSSGKMVLLLLKWSLGNNITMWRVMGAKQ